MTTHTRVALGVLFTSSLTAAGGAWLVQHARALPPPDRLRPAEIPGVVSEVLAQGCGPARRRRTCYRPVVDYLRDGAKAQAVARTAYRTSSPHHKGDPVAVLVEKDGEAWLAPEWDRRLAEREREHASARGFPLVMGWVLVGCGGLGLALAAGLVFFADRGPTA